MIKRLRFVDLFAHFRHRG